VAQYNPLRIHEFQPLVISTGGIFSTGTVKILDAWSMEMGKVETGRMLEAVSVLLLISRARLYQHCLLLNRTGGRVTG